MKKYSLFSIIIFLSLNFISCGGGASGGEDKVLPPPTISKAVELTTPTIVSPQQDAVCQGTKQANGKFNVVVKSTEHYGADTYLFQVWNSKGELVDEVTAKTNQAKITNMEQGYAYTLAVTISSTSATKQSNKISFCTPGVQTTNYIPTVKSATYSQKNSTLSIILHDPDDSDTELFYTVITSDTKDFQDKKIIANNKSASKQTTITLSKLTLDFGIYIKIIVKDNIGSQSSYSFQIKA